MAASPRLRKGTYAGAHFRLARHRSAGHEGCVGVRSTPTARAEPSRRTRIVGHHETRAFLHWLVFGAVGALRIFASFAIGYAGLGLAAFGVFRRGSEASTTQLLALGGLFLLLIARLFERVQRGARANPRAALVADLELGTLFVAAAFVVIEITGGPGGLSYPLVFALVAFLVAFHRPLASIYFLVLILGAEALVTYLQPTPEGWKLFASHASFNLLFGLLYALFLRTEVAQRHHTMQREITRYLEGIDSEAQQFRLTSGLSFEGKELTSDELGQRRRVGSVQAIHQSLYNVLEVAERALSPHTVALLWMDSDDKQLRVKELRSQCDVVTEKPIAVGEGLLGAIVKRGEPLVLQKLKPGHTGLVYYDGKVDVTDFAGVPVREGKHLRGVLVADRIDGRPFEDADIAVLTTISDEIVRAVQVERIFSEMDREKYQKERFYEASREFNKARTVEEVSNKTLFAARRVAQAELTAVAVATEREGRLRIVAVEWTGKSDLSPWLGKEFAAEEGLCGAAIKARHPLPHGTARAQSQHVFGPNIELPLPAVKVVPLVWQDRGVGALVLAGQRGDFLPAGVLDMLKVIADHAAIAVANAQMYEHMERMATTDGLTGLTNHRTFQEMFDGHIARAERYSRKLSVILTDIDHFKSINDTYGHPVGDKVLKRVAAILQQQARRTDVVARYGGEEFAVLMEETDRSGARIIAERIRKAIEAETFHADSGSFKATVSLGIATFPEDAGVKAKLTEAADQALYAAKREGRNRTITFDQVLTKPRREAATHA
jgi:two-component system, cell cycle response regulator